MKLCSNNGGTILFCAFPCWNAFLFLGGKIMHEYTSVKNYEELYHNLWYNVATKLDELQKILHESSELSCLLKYREMHSNQKTNPNDISTSFDENK